MESAKTPVACVPLISETQFRPVVNFPPEVWGNRFDSLSSNQKAELERYDREVELWKKKVEAMLMEKSNDAVEQINFIDLLCRLGLSYHFQTKIEKHLNQIFNSQPHFLDKKDYDLSTVAVVFRVLRQHGLKMPCDVFNKFKDGETGKFQDSLTNDPKGLLSMFEAAHLCTHGEDILDEALVFTRSHLKLLMGTHQLEPNLAKYIANSLRMPLHRGPPRLKAREFISFYEDCSQDCHLDNDILLKFAKSDFNWIQLVHQQELKNIFKWSKDLDLASKLPYARNRVMEFFFWAISVYFEPKYAYARVEYVKQVHLATFLDDTYDSYGTLEELQILTDAFERWDRAIVDQLPKDYMKYLYKAYLETFDELEKQATQDRTSVAVSMFKDSLVELTKAYLREMQWRKSGYIPSFEESFELGIMTAGFIYMNALAFVGMRDHFTLQGVQWLQANPDVDKATAMLSRLWDEVGSYKRDRECGLLISPFFSYQRENNLSDEETVAEMQRKISITWKTLNEELMRQVPSVPLEILTIVLNFPRFMEATYKDGDGITNANNMADYIKILFIEPIPF